MGTSYGKADSVDDDEYLNVDDVRMQNGTVAGDENGNCIS